MVSVMDLLLARVPEHDHDCMRHILSKRIGGPVSYLCRATPSAEIPAVARELVAWIHTNFPIADEEEEVGAARDWEHLLAHAMIDEWLFSCHGYCYNCEFPELVNDEIESLLIAEVDLIHSL